MKSINAREDMTAREREEFEQQKELLHIQAGYQTALKDKELELHRLELKWSQVFRLPFAILMLPVRFLFGIGYIAHAIRGTKPDDKFWQYLRQL